MLHEEKQVVYPGGGVACGKACDSDWLFGIREGGPTNVGDIPQNSISEAPRMIYPHFSTRKIPAPAQSLAQTEFADACVRADFQATLFASLFPLVGTLRYPYLSSQ